MDKEWMGRKSAGRKVKDKRIDTGDKSARRRAGGGEVGRISSSSVVCSSGLAGKTAAGWGEGVEGGFEGGGKGSKNFRTLHLHEFDRPLENTRATFEKATPRKVKWQPRGDRTRADVLKLTPTPPLKLWHPRAITVETLS